MDLIVDDEFDQLCGTLTAEELNLLDASIDRDGCRDAIVVWKDHNIILDGHNRYRLCKSGGYGFKTKELAFSDRHEAMNWIIDNQLGKRNLSEERKAYLRGKRYSAEKKEHGKRGKEKTGQNVPSSIRSSQKIAAQCGVDEKTIRRDAKFAEAVDKIETAKPESRKEILSGESKLSKRDVVEIAELEPEEIPAEVERRKAEKPRPATLSGTEKLIEGIEKLIDKANSLAAVHNMGHNAQSRALVAHLKESVKLVKAMAKSWRNV